jgi:hypothetical protein
MSVEETTVQPTWSAGDLEPTTEEIGGRPDEEPVPTSPMLAAIRAKQAAHAGEHSYDVDVPGYDGLLVIRCGPLGGRRLTAIRTRMETSKSPDREQNVNLDTLIEGCREVLGREDIHDPLVPLDDELPVRIDKRLSRMLGLPETTSAREVLLGVFAGANDPDMAIGVAAGSFLEWCSSANGQIAEDVLGE